MVDEDKRRAKVYSRYKILLFFAQLVILFLYLVLFQIGGYSQSTRDLLERFVPHYYVTLALYLTVFSFIHFLAAIPLGFYGGYILEHKFSLSNQKLSDWIKDEIKKGLISFVVFLLLLEVFYFILYRFPAGWWILCSVVWFSFSVVFAKLLPVLIIPLFYKYRPIADKALRDRILKLTDMAKVKVLDVFEIDFSKKTKKSNAAFVGWGKTRRVILVDNLIEEFSPEEVEVVVAHEIGHYKLLHMWKTLLAAGLSIFVSFYILKLISGRLVSCFGARGIYDIALFPSIYFVFALLSLIAMPLQNGYSRRLERHADGFSLRLIGHKGAFISTMEKLASKNLADKNPNKIIVFLLYDHPPISKRIEFAKHF